MPYKPVLLVSNRYYIRNVSLHGNFSELLAWNLSNAVALDFYWPHDTKNLEIFWSDVTSEGSSISRMIIDMTNRTSNISGVVVNKTVSVNGVLNSFLVIW